MGRQLVNVAVTPHGLVELSCCVTAMQVINWRKGPGTMYGISLTSRALFQGMQTR
jgi:hypothetical protein